MPLLFKGYFSNQQKVAHFYIWLSDFLLSYTQIEHLKGGRKMVRHVYPGSFCPPTLGHLRIVERAAALLPEVVIVCSKDENKNNRWFREEECKDMWLAYQLPSNVSVHTFDELRGSPASEYVMIRGIRNADDYGHEQKVMELNNKRFGINNYLYLIAEPDFSEISSSLVRSEAEKLSLETLHHYVAPMIVSQLLEHVLCLNNLIMVVGKPASGKSTFLRMLGAIDVRNVVIETDQWSDSFKPLLKERFACDDLIRLALERDQEVSHAIKEMWFAKLKESLGNVLERSNVFVEAAYGLSANKALFRFLGGRILYLGCEDDEVNKRRMIVRGTPELIPFLERIPNLEESQRIAQKNNLSFLVVNTLCKQEELEAKARALNATISQKNKKEETRVYEETARMEENYD